MLTLFNERYEVLGTVGAGGEATVVKALDRRHDRLVALKVRQVRDDASREALLAEARVLLSLPPHPALPLMREDFFDRDDYVVAMDWVEGTDLATLLAERGRAGLATSSVLGYLAQAAEALTHLHAQSPPVIHGDLKPGNLLLGTGGRIKLVDFGLSSTPDGPLRRSGTPGFRAPELVTGGRPTRASDIYALAATAFALLTGSAPDGVLPDWDGIDPARARQLEDAIRLGMATDPARRPATPGELVERLRAGWETGLPTGVVTVCCSEIDDAARLWDPDPKPMAQALVRHDELIAAVVERGGGRVVRAQGESGATVSVFHSATQALDAAVAAQRALGAEPWPAGLRLGIRWGIHTGEGIDPAAALGGRVRAQADVRRGRLTCRTRNSRVALQRRMCNAVVTHGPPDPRSTPMTHRIGTRDEWRAARAALLEREKELTRLNDALARERQALPWVPVEKEYVFDSPDGPVTLAELFGGRSQLIVQHLMFGPGDERACASCSSIADGINGPHEHLEHHDVAFAAVSRAPLPTLEEYRARMGWSFRWVSSHGSDFNFDFGVSGTPERPNREYNLAPVTGQQTGEWPGMSAFALQDGVVHHAYSAHSRGIDAVWGVYPWLDRAPKGRRDETYWHRRRYEYATVAA